MTFKKFPAGFFQYHLRSGKWFYTSRTIEDFKPFMDQVQSICDGLNANDFHEHVTSSCKYCDYFMQCTAAGGDRPLTVSPAVTDVDDVDGGTFQYVIPGVQVVQPKQMRFKNFHVARVKKNVPQQTLFGLETAAVNIITLPKREEENSP
jgi:hypothetical protein